MVEKSTPAAVASVRFDGFMSYSHAADDLLAPRLQTALQTFAKPWWKRRAVRVFRDQSSLSANPHLWSSITEALNSSEWFILLTSPEAASSPWVDREVAYWLEHKGPDRILPVLTDGTLDWDEKAGRLAEGSAVPPSLIDAFPGEPRWVDLSWAEDETQLDLRNAGFHGAVADVASSLRGIPKDDLESEEVRQHRRTRRTAWGAGIALAALAVAAVIGFVVARNNENLARSRELAASAINLLDQDPELSILLGLQAIEASPRATEAVEPLNALREAVHASRLRGRYLASPAGGLVWIDLSPDGTRLAVMAEREGTVSLLDTDTLQPLWVYSDPETVDSFIRVNFSQDGSLIAVGVREPGTAISLFLPQAPRPGAQRDDGLPPRVLLLDAATGALRRTIELPSCPEQAPTPVFSPDGRWLAVGGLTDCAAAGGGEVLLFDLATYEQTSIHHADETGLLSWTADGSALVVGHYDVQATMGTTIIDISTMEPVVLTLKGALITPDGSRLVVGALLTQEVFDLATGARVDILGGLNQIVAARLITEDGGRLIVGTMGQELWVYDLESGEQLLRLGPTGPPNSMACRGSCDTLYQANDRGEVNVWDLSQEAGGELNTSSTGYFVNSEGVHATEQMGVFLGITLSDFLALAVPFDPATGRLHSARRATETNHPTALPDGRIVLIESSGTAPEFGPVVAWDPETNEVEKVFGCWTTAEMMEQSEFGLLGDPPCTDTDGSYFTVDTIHLSPDRRSFLVSNSIGQVRIFDSATLEETAGLQLPPGHVIVLAYGGSWLASKDPETAYIVSVDSGNVLATLGPAPHRHFAAVSSDSRLLALTFLRGQVRIYDTATWEPVSTFDTKTQTRGHAISPDGSMLMTASSDGYVRVWDMRAGEELARIPVPDPSDGYWLDDTHVVVGTTNGLWTTLTLDLEELTDLALSRLTRSFTADECALYRIDPCPTLDDLKSR